MATRGFTLWFTGLSGSGKSTLANAAAQNLEAAGRRVDLLDGDVVRQHLSKGLGFSKADRDENIRRIGYVAHLITRVGGAAITAAISPYRSVRDANREMIGAGSFIEIYCNCPLEECERRDVKGLYKKARAKLAAGEHPGFTGLDDPYEPPEQPEVVCHTGRETVAESVAKIGAYLHGSGLLDVPSGNAAAGVHREFIPAELTVRAEHLFRAAGRVQTDVLMRELHVGFDTAAQIIDRLGAAGKIGMKQGPV